MVSLKVRWVVLTFEDNFTQHDEGPKRGDLARCLPFLPNAFEGLPSVFGEGAFEKAMLRGLRDPNVKYLARRGDPHTLEPSSNGHATIEGQPD
ncbi:unnamed protein product [Sphagnum jensenii]|uniref:Uncharacterized protein n=1 Tax=Sphagnum jensenii TaxID=128206 RepID=A0ABP1C1I3_9BRYO